MFNKQILIVGRDGSQWLVTPQIGPSVDQFINGLEKVARLLKAVETIRETTKRRN